MTKSIVPDGEIFVKLWVEGTGSAVGRCGGRFSLLRRFTNFRIDGEWSVTFGGRMAAWLK